MLNVPSQLADSQVISDIDALIERHGRNRGALIPILSDLRANGGISDLAMQVVADRLGIKPVDVYGVVSFYSFLGDRPVGEKPGRYTVRVCRTLSCRMGALDAVATALQSELGISFGQTTDDGEFTLEWTNCIGMCDQAPAMLINDRVYGNLTPEAAVQAIRETRGQ